MMGHESDAGARIVGRERELVALREALDRALAGQGGLVLIGGAAGLGKTTLAEEACREAAGRGALVLTGRCYDLAETPPYGQWAEALARAPRDDELPALPTAVLPPEGGGEAVSGQDAIIRRVQTYLTVLAARQRLVLLLEDLHWADPASLDLLRVVARGLREVPILLLATYRADEVAGDHPLATLLPALVRESRAERLDLRPLDETAIGALVAARYALGDTDRARLVGYLATRTEGNALFLGELLRTLEGEGLLRLEGAGWAVSNLEHAPIPALLRQVIEGRVARLDQETRRLLAIAAIIGQAVPLALWATVAEVAEEVLLDHAERAIEARLLVETPDGTSVRFVHALIREALYVGTSALRRRGLHRRVGEALAEGTTPDPDAMAYHLRQAGDARAVAWLDRAAERAFRAYARASAVERLEAALPLLDSTGADPGDRAWFLFRLARLLRGEDPERGLAYLESAAPLAAAAGDHALAAYITFDMGFVSAFVSAGGARQTLAGMAAGVAALDALSPEQRVVRGGRDNLWLADSLPAHLGGTGERGDALSTAGMNIRLGTLACWLGSYGPYAETIALGERALAEASDSLPLNVFALNTTADAALGLGLAYAGLGRSGVARAAYIQAARHYRAIDHHGLEASSLARAFETVTMVYEADNLNARAAEMAAIEQTVERARTQTGGTFNPSPVNRIPLLYLAGRWDEALELVPHNLFYAAWAGVINRARGEQTSAWQAVRDVLPEGPATEPGEGVFYQLEILQRVAAGLALDAGDLPTAREWLAAHDRWLVWSGAIAGQAEGALGWAAYHRASGDLASAREAAERSLARATEPRQPLALLAAHHLLGELDTATGRHADAAAHLDTALALADACEARYERALCLLARAELRAAFPAGQGKLTEANSDLDDARATFAKLGAAPALARADVIAARLAAPVAAPAALPFGLTAREAEVLRLVAEGLTDPQMAERLFVSRNTINAHLRGIYGKLGVNTRAAAARLALEHGLA